MRKEMRESRVVWEAKKNKFRIMSDRKTLNFHRRYDDKLIDEDVVS